ncbi:hypothetical protein AAH029_16150 [Parabacteroides distasonis]|uniref:hypothetical protein n=1 Tax=Parabacteroides distasonis TaxID=823 RepID=UPI0039B4F097
MAKITKVKSAYLERLNNAEYRTFMARYGNLLAGGGGDSESPHEMTTYAFAQSVVKPTATTATSINRLNTLIDETNALYNQRIAQARAAAKKQADSESPSEI